MARLWALVLLAATCKDPSSAQPPTPAPLPPATGAPRPMDETARIDALLQAVASSDLTFVRNGTGYSGAEAAAHLRSKWQAAGARIGTAEQFVDQIGSVSSTTGRPYVVRLPDGRELPAGEWMRAELARLSPPSAPPAPPVAPAAPAPPPAAAKVVRGPEDVLALLRASPLVFLLVESDEIERHSGASLAGRIALKYRIADAPSLSAEEFVRLFCTRSVLHGTEYLVELPDGTRRPLGAWLLEQIRY